MKLEVGMYVRTKDGIIGKYNVIKEWTNVPTLNGYYEAKEIEREYIDNKLYRNYKVVKASHNIIDLIEVGDYVNGFRVDEIGEYHSYKTDKVETYAKVNCSKLLNCFYEEDIKSIVTKEQFESMSYKVEEE